MPPTPTVTTEKLSVSPTLPFRGFSLPVTTPVLSLLAHGSRPGLRALPLDSGGDNHTVTEGDHYQKVNKFFSFDLEKVFTLGFGCCVFLVSSAPATDRLPALTDGNEGSVGEHLRSETPGASSGDQTLLWEDGV